MDYYKILNLNPDAENAAILSAYKLGLNRFNPDIRGQAAGFKRTFEAYYMLNDVFRRKNYDSFYFSQLLDTEEFKIWRRNQLKKQNFSKDDTGFYLLENIAGDAIGSVIVEGISEIVSSIFD